VSAVVAMFFPPENVIGIYQKTGRFTSGVPSRPNACPVKAATQFRWC